MYKVLHLRDDVDRLYVSRRESIEDSVNALIQRLEDYIKKSAEEGWLQRPEYMQTTQASAKQK